MPRRRTPKKRIVLPDPVYESRLIELLVRQIMRQGKKSLAYKIIYDCMNQLADTTQQEPLAVIEQAVRNATPLLEVKARRIGGSTYQVPLEVRPDRGTALAIRWILTSCRNLLMHQKILVMLFENVKRCIKWQMRIKLLQSIDFK
jgi:small subunit ribosomal protein S7